MDLSTRAAKRLRLDDFLKQNLVEAPARNLIEWVDSRQGVFRILWTHQSSGDFNTGDAALFRYWAIARGKSPDGLSSVDLKQSLRMALNKSPSVQKLPSVHDDRYYRYFRVKEHILSVWWQEYPRELEKFSPCDHSPSTLKSTTDYNRLCLPSRSTSPPFASSCYEDNSTTMNVPRFLVDEPPSAKHASSSHREPGQLFRPYALEQMDDTSVHMESQSSESLLLLDEKDYYAPKSFNESLILENDSKNNPVNSQYLSPDGGYYSSSGSSPGSSSLDDISRTMYLNSQTYLLPEGGYYSSPGSSPVSYGGADKPRKEYLDSHSLVSPVSYGGEDKPRKEYLDSHSLVSPVSYGGEDKPRKEYLDSHSLVSPVSYGGEDKPRKEYLDSHSLVSPVSYGGEDKPRKEYLDSHSLVSPVSYGGEDKPRKEYLDSHSLVSPVSYGGEDKPRKEYLDSHSLVSPVSYGGEDKPRKEYLDSHSLVSPVSYGGEDKPRKEYLDSHSLVSPVSYGGEDKPRKEYLDSHSLVSPVSYGGEDKPRKEYLDSHSLVLPEKIDYLNGGTHLSSSTEEATRWSLQSEDTTYVNRCESVPQTISSPSGDLIISTKHKRSKNIESKVKPRLASGVHLNQQSSSCSLNSSSFPNDSFGFWNNETTGLDDTKYSTIGKTELERASIWGQGDHDQEQCNQFQLQSF